MKIWGIADLHLSFAKPKPMDIFGEDWKNHPEITPQQHEQHIHDSNTSTKVYELVDIDAAPFLRTYLMQVMIFDKESCFGTHYE